MRRERKFNHRKVVVLKVIKYIKSMYYMYTCTQNIYIIMILKLYALQNKIEYPF